MAGKHDYDEEELPKAMRKNNKTSRNKNPKIRDKL